MYVCIYIYVYIYVYVHVYVPIYVSINIHDYIQKYGGKAVYMFNNHAFEEFEGVTGWDPYKCTSRPLRVGGFGDPALSVMMALAFPNESLSGLRHTIHTHMKILISKFSIYI